MNIQHDRYDPIEAAYGDGSWKGLLSAFAFAVQAFAEAFNPFFMLAAFLITATGLCLWLPYAFALPLPQTFLLAIVSASIAAYIVGKHGNKIALYLVALVVIAIATGCGYLLWVLMSYARHLSSITG